ncbi:MAG: IS66 family insertion sequence element accessory protein TnpB [Rhodocyclales bacterium]|nr:IS66 family insertion sequence element accessory protein TnpB [Rhodocyclales bacterium]
MLAVEPVDFRRSIDGLSEYVMTTLRQDPRVERAFFVFANAKRDRAKVLWRDATGWCLLYKRFDKNVVPLPASVPAGAKSVVIDPRAFAKLLDGVARVRRETAKDVARTAKEKVRTLIKAPTS